MRIELCNIFSDKKGAELITNHGKVVIYGITENILRCVYTKRENILAVSPLEIEAEPKADVTVDETTDAYLISTERVCVEVEKESGRFTWKDLRNATVLLEEEKKELTENPLIVYTIGEEEPIIKRVVTVDGERNFIENLKPETDHIAYRGRLYLRWADGEMYSICISTT